MPLRIEDRGLVTIEYNQRSDLGHLCRVLPRCTATGVLAMGRGAPQELTSSKYSTYG